MGRAFGAGRRQHQIRAATRLHLKLDEANGSTSFSDSGPTAHSVTRGGSAVTSNAQSKFYDTSLLLTRSMSSDDVSVAIHADFTPGADDWTWSCWFYMNSVDGAGYYPLIHNGDSSNAPFVSYAAHANNNEASCWVRDTTTQYGTKLADPIPSTSAWHHMLLVRDGDTVRWFIDGDPTATATIDVSTDTLRTPTGAVYVGNNYTAAYADGYFSEVSYQKGLAVQYQAFTPPITAFAI